jgi:hypothetical protein
LRFAARVFVPAYVPGYGGPIMLFNYRLINSIVILCRLVNIAQPFYLAIVYRDDPLAFEKGYLHRMYRIPDGR